TNLEHRVVIGNVERLEHLGHQTGRCAGAGHDRWAPIAHLCDEDVVPVDDGKPLVELLRAVAVQDLPVGAGVPEHPRDESVSIGASKGSPPLRRPQDATFLKAGDQLLQLWLGELLNYVHGLSLLAEWPIAVDLEGLRRETE